jgi:histidine triad (HIT) family protein
MDDCIFCKIIKGEIPSFKVYEDEKHLAFLDISQFTRGHTLLVPKKHVANFWEIEDPSEITKVLHKIGRHFKAIGFKYVDTLTFGRMVPHLHFHLVPHNGDDKEWSKALSGLEYFQNNQRFDKEQLKLIAEEVRL